MFHRKEEVVLKVDCNSDSDESVDVMDSSAVNMKRLDLPTTIKKNVKE
jgi:hypothetical protein